LSRFLIIIYKTKSSWITVSRGSGNRIHFCGGS
jgi:hypothetical protein